MMSHFPSLFLKTVRYLPTSTVAPDFAFTAYVPDSQPRSPEAPTSLLASRLNVTPAFADSALSLAKYA